MDILFTNSVKNSNCLEVGFTINADPRREAKYLLTGYPLSIINRPKTHRVKPSPNRAQVLSIGSAQMP